MENYVVTRLESWSDETWAEVIDAVEETVASFGEGNGCSHPHIIIHNEQGETTCLHCGGLNT